MNKLLLLTVMSLVVVEAKKPNVMIVFGDDVGTGDVPGYWNTSQVDMPNLERLLTQGTSFTDAHSTPLCAPSRYVLLSGNYQHRGEQNSGTWTMNYSKGSQFRSGQKSIADVLRDAGYNTAMFGKWHIGGYIPLGEGYTPKPNDVPDKKILLSNNNHDWSKPIPQGPGHIGFENSYITIEGIQNPPYAFVRNDIVDGLGTNQTNLKYWDKGKSNQKLGTSIISREGEGVDTWDSTAYNMILVNETEKFLDDHKLNHEDEPFFAYVALGSVHTPHSPPIKYMDGSEVAGKYETTHMDVLGEMDKVVGSLMSMLESKDLMEDTIFIFTSDNGGLGVLEYSSNHVGHLSSGLLRDHKDSIYEGGHRIPMTIRWDKGEIPRGEKRSSHFVGLNDLFATICELTNVTIPKVGQAVDSVSFAKYALDASNTEGLRDYIGTWAYEKYTKMTLESSAIRMGSMKLIYHSQNGGSLELFDLSNDISEKADIISSANSTLVEHMYTKMQEIGPCRDRPGRFRIKKRKNKKTSCNFIKKKAWKRCQKFPEAWINCGYICSAQCKRLQINYKPYSSYATE